MRDLPLETACAIYRKDYWDRIKGDLITDQQIAEKLCDMAVNFGTATAVMILQDVLNALNDRATLWGDLPVTGNFGPMTLEALSHALSQHPQHRRSILFGLAACAGARYIAICKRDPEQERFARGWLLRAELL
jgi:lysozyme family protein